MSIKITAPWNKCSELQRLSEDGTIFLRKNFYTCLRTCIHAVTVLPALWRFLFLVLCIPCIATILTYTFGNVFVFHFLSLWCKNLHYQSNPEEADPFKWNPPPSNEKPPTKAMMFVFDFRFCHYLHSYIFTSAFWTFHFSYLSSFVFLR